MSYYDHLFVSPLLEEEQGIINKIKKKFNIGDNKKSKSEKRQVKTDIWEKINPFYWLGKAQGSMQRAYDKGFHNSYKGARNKLKAGYSPEHTVDESTDCLFGCGPIGDSLYKNDINGTSFSRYDRKATDPLFRNGPGEDWGYINEPAFRASRIVNSIPHPMSAGNGINEDIQPFSLKNYRRY